MWAGTTSARPDRVAGPRGGFTLIELAVVVAVMSVIAALSLSAFSRLKDRARLNTFHSNLVASLQSARNRAMVGQRPVIAVLLQSTSGNAPDRYVIFEDKDSNFAANTFDPDAIAAPDVKIEDQTVAGSVGWGPTTGWPTAFPAPFNVVPTGSACTFGSAGFPAPYDRRCWVSFNGDGSLSLSNGAQAGSISLFDKKQTSRVVGIALVAPSAAVKGYIQ